MRDETMAPARGMGAESGVSIGATHIAGRAVVRGDVTTIEETFTTAGLPTPPAVNRAATGDAVSLLRLGPDEWLALSTRHGAGQLAALLSDALTGHVAAVVDVTQRQVAIVVEGPAAADALSTGVPLDLHPSCFPVGMATRTIFDKAEIILWRTGPERFHIEVWRSFAPYVEALLDAARAELAAGL